MTILWCGTGDLDFPTPMPGGITCNYMNPDSNPIAGCRTWENIGIYTGLPMWGSDAWGAGVTSLWFRVGIQHNYAANQPNTPVIGVGKAGVNAGIFIGTGANNRPAIVKWDGTTATVLAQSASARPSTNVFYDLRISNHGAAATVALYIGNVEYIPPTVVDTTLAGLTNFDCVKTGKSDQSQNGTVNVAGMIVADGDTRLYPGLQQARVIGAGDANAWDGGTYGEVDELGTTVDGDSINSNIAGRDVQFALEDVWNTTYKPAAVKVLARVAKTVGAVPGNVGCGVKTGGSITNGNAQAVAESKWENKSQMYALNPTTGVAWTAAEITSLQLNLHTS